MGWACSTHVSHDKCVQNFGLKPEVKGSLQRPRRRLENNIERNRLWYYGVKSSALE